MKFERYKYSVCEACNTLNTVLSNGASLEPQDHPSLSQCWRSDDVHGVDQDRR